MPSEPSASGDLAVENQRARGNGHRSTMCSSTAKVRGVVSLLANVANACVGASTTVPCPKPNFCFCFLMFCSVPFRLDAQSTCDCSETWIEEKLDLGDGATCGVH